MPHSSAHQWRKTGCRLDYVSFVLRLDCDLAHMAAGHDVACTALLQLGLRMQPKFLRVYPAKLCCVEFHEEIA
jgi:hypothetical protein